MMKRILSIYALAGALSLLLGMPAVEAAYAVPWLPIGMAAGGALFGGLFGGGGDGQDIVDPATRRYIEEHLRPQGLSLARQFQGSGLNLDYGPESYRAYMDPYLEDVVETTMGSLDVARRRALNEARARLTASGTSRGSRAGITTGLIEGEYARAAPEIEARLRSQGFYGAHGLALGGAQHNMLRLQAAQQAMAGGVGPAGGSFQEAAPWYERALGGAVSGGLLGHSLAGGPSIDLPSRTATQPLPNPAGLPSGMPTSVFDPRVGYRPPGLNLTNVREGSRPSDRDRAFYGRYSGGRY